MNFYILTTSMPKPHGTLNWDLESIANSLRLSPEDTKSYFTDGRRVSFILERRLAFDVLNG